MRPELAHVWGMTDEAFMTLIDSTGGWPVGYDYVGFEHTDVRKAGFCKESYNTGWWTILHHADDYYLWKMSPAGVQRIVEAVRSAMFIPAVDSSKLRIKGWRGYITPRAPAQTGGVTQ